MSQNAATNMTLKQLKVYGIGGLGVDERIFSELDLKFELFPLKWIDPEPDETMKNYVSRLSKQIDTRIPFSIIGVSFGGIVALELNKILSPEKVILISSARSKYDIPFLFRLAGKMRLLKLIPDSLMKPPAFLSNYFFGVSELEYKALLQQIISDTDTDFLRWAIHQITTWEYSENPKNLISIHGSSDRLLKFQNDDQVKVVPDAGHFMIVDRATELSNMLNKVITED